jgi:hypothetical protein
VSDDNAFWDLYVSAVIECEIDGRVQTLRGPSAGALPADAPIFVLTAYNPGGIYRDASRNEADERALEHELERAGVSFWPALGGSRDGSWSEPGVAVAGFDRARACALGERYGQLAVFELTKNDVHVVRCDNAEIVRTADRRT